MIPHIVESSKISILYYSFAMTLSNEMHVRVRKILVNLDQIVQHNAK
jgi:hypothetical protein